MQCFLVFLNLILLSGIHRTLLHTQSPRSRSHVKLGEAQPPFPSPACPSSGSSHLQIARWPPLKPPYLPSVTWAAPSTIAEAKPVGFLSASVPPDPRSCWTSALGTLRPPLILPGLLCLLPRLPTHHCPGLTSFFSPDTDSHTSPSS